MTQKGYLYPDLCGKLFGIFDYWPTDMKKFQELQRFKEIVLKMENIEKLKAEKKALVTICHASATPSVEAGGGAPDLYYRKRLRRRCRRPPNSVRQFCC